MLPTLAEGDYVVAFRWWWSIQVDDLIIARHSNLPFLIKRVKSIDKLGNLLLQGDGKKSLSTEQIGKIVPSQVLGKIIYTSRARRH